MRYCWNDVTLRACFLYWSAMALFVPGPLQVALPLLAARVCGLAAIFAGVGVAMLAVVLVGFVATPIRHLSEA